MKVLLVSSLYPPDVRGGAEVVAAAEAASLRAAGHEVTVLTTAASGGRWQRQLGESGILVIRRRPLNLFSFQTIGAHSPFSRALWHLLDTLSPSASAAVRRILADGGYDLAITHNLKGFGYTAAVALRRSGVRWVHTCHDVQLLVPSGLILWGAEAAALRPWNRLYAAVCRRLFGSPSEVLFGSRWLKDTYESRGFFGGAKLTVAQPSLGATVAERPVTADGELRLLFVGQVERHKGVVWLVRSLQAVERELGRPVRLTVAGTGRALAEVAAAGSARVRCVGQVPSSAVLELMAEHDVVVVPSLCYENAPTVILEARASGTPVVVSRVGGAPELALGESRCFTPGNEAALVACLRQLPRRQL